MNSNKIICSFILFAINLLNYMDRYSVAGVLTHIQTYFDISDSEGGLLQTVFIVFFMIFAPISGFLGDRYNRKMIIGVGLTIWVAAVLASSFVPANSFWLFLLLRGAVGIGEASYSIIAPTLLADLFVGNARSRALMFFYFAIPVGSGLGYVIGSNVATAMNNDWKWGIRVTPLLSVISIIVFMLFVDEPERGQAEHEQNAGAPEPSRHTKSSYMDDLKYLFKIKTYLWGIVGYTAVVFVTGTLAWWAPAAIDHSMAMQDNLPDSSKLDPSKKDRVAVIFGALTCIGGIIGVSLGTYLAQLWKEGKFCFASIRSLRADPLISGAGALAAVPLMFISFQFIATQIYVAWVTIFFCVTLVSLNCAINVDMLMYIIVPQRRSIANSWQITFSHLFGDASGPYVVGLISDLIRGSDDSPAAHYRSLVVAFYAPNVMLIVGGVAYLICAMTLPQDIKNFRKEMNLRHDINNGLTNGYERNNSQARIGCEGPIRREQSNDPRHFGDFTSV